MSAVVGSQYGATTGTAESLITQLHHRNRNCPHPLLKGKPWQSRKNYGVLFKLSACNPFSPTETYQSEPTYTEGQDSVKG
jgi:hypothetical protein